MWKSWIFAVVVSSVFIPHTKAEELHNISCTVVRFYVAKYSAPVAETWARSRGATETEIVAARRCLKDMAVQTASDLGSVRR